MHVTARAKRTPYSRGRLCRIFLLREIVRESARAGLSSIAAMTETMRVIVSPTKALRPSFQYIYFFSDARSSHHYIRNRLHLFLTRRTRISYVCSLTLDPTELSFLLVLIFRIILVAYSERVFFFFRAEIPSTIRRRYVCQLKRAIRESSIASRFFFNAWELLLIVTHYMTLVARQTQIVYYFVEFR